MADASIVRNRAKIEAAVANARAALDLPRGLAETVWRYADPDPPAYADTADVPAYTDASKALAKELKKHGFRFVGPTTAYALMQACGLVDDHLTGCHRHGAYRWAARPPPPGHSALAASRTGTDAARRAGRAEVASVTTAAPAAITTNSHQGGSGLR